jgi:coniferyl-aldehyde dehydrogenase
MTPSGTLGSTICHSGELARAASGHYHGVDGFLTFSKLRPVFYQTPFSGMRLLWPPFGALADRVLDFLTR